ncbi:MAG: exo-alpha-sialidase [Candidatus Sumerlaeota bacterium]|nr:exo-alpha-sialidase [Candidatus Sumerlaeota bacterium]
MKSEIMDVRNVAGGRTIPAETYCDQPYVVKTDDGAWLCVMTTGAGREGQAGQHVVSMRSADQGRTWSLPVDVEPVDGPEASYAVLLKTSGGRIYCFYNHNTDNLRHVFGDDPPFRNGRCERVDSLGYFVFRYSDDHGRTWSSERTPIPVREMEIDRANPYGGRVRFFWNVGRPFVHGGAAFVPLHKVGGFGEGFFMRSEGVLLRSDNILVERDPAKIRWETLPEGNIGLRTPPGGGPIAEEHSFSVLSDGSFFCVYRTADGHPACAYSRDGGRTWGEPRYLRYGDGRRVKHPRAANFAWKCSNGKFLYWFHNHGGRFIREATKAFAPYEDRNPAWLCGGIEADLPEGRIILWSQPEIVLYDDDPFIRMSYPDLVEESGRFFLTETQKAKARTHEIAPGLLVGLWGQFENQAVARDGLVLSLPGPGLSMPSEAEMPRLPLFVRRSATREDYGTEDLRRGFSIDVRVRFDSLEPWQNLLDNRDQSGRGLLLQTTPRETLEIVLNDGRTENRWDCDPGTLEAGQLQHVVVIVDGGPRIVCFVIDGRLCDGGEFRQFGWGRFSPHLRGVAGGQTLRIGHGLNGEIRSLRIYDRALRISEAVGNWRAGL